MSSGNHALLSQLGKRIQLLRKRKGWTQIDMAVALDMNRGHTSDIEQGKREVGIITFTSDCQWARHHDGEVTEGL